MYQLTKLYLDSKIRYNTLVRPPVLYASECVNIVRNGQLSKLELKDHKIL